MKKLVLTTTMLTIAFLLSPAAVAQTSCCVITALDSHSLTATAKVSANGQTFDFRTTDAKLFSGLRIGQGVFANFSTHQVSVDGKTACCSIVKLENGAGMAVQSTHTNQQPQTAQSPPNKPGTEKRTDAGRNLGTGSTGIQASEPSTQQAIRGAPAGGPFGNTQAPGNAKPLGVAFNPRIEMLAQGTGWKLQRHTGVFNGQTLTFETYEMVGRAGIEAANVPAEYKQILIKASQSLPLEESVFFVPAGIIQQWERRSGPQYQSWVSSAYQCATNSEETVEGNLAPQSFNQVFNLQKPFTLGSASSVSASGTVSLHVPVSGDVGLAVALFHDTCLGFYRPKEFTVDGNIVSTPTLAVDLQKITATGEFSTPEASLPLPVIVIPVSPDLVVEVDIGLFALGGIKMNASAELDARFSANAEIHGDSLRIHCDGHGCSPSGQTRAKFSVAENAGLRGQGVRAQLQPYIFTGIDLRLQQGTMGTAELGPRPYVIADAWGYQGTECAVPAQGTPKLGNTSGVAPITALTLDLDAGMDIHYKANILSLKKEGSLGDVIPRLHIPGAFWDLLGNSTGLSPVLRGDAQPAALQPATYQVRMHPCYPYTDAVEYSLGWAGAGSSAVPSANIRTPASLSSRGSSGSAENTHTSGPPQTFADVKHTWPAAGSFVIEATPLRDAHGRVFPTRPSTLSVNVQPPSTAANSSTTVVQPRR